MEFTTLQSEILEATRKSYEDWFSQRPNDEIWIDCLTLLFPLKQLGYHHSPAQISAALGQLASKGVFKRHYPDKENRRNGFNAIIYYLTPLGRNLLAISPSS